jgi:hypothetical protein
MRELVGVRGYAQEVEEIGQAGLEVEACLLQAGEHLGAKRLWAIVRGDAAIIPQQVKDGQVGDAAPVRQAVSFHIPDALPGEALAKLVEQPRFAHAWRPDQTHSLAPASHDLLQDGVQQQQFPFPTY